VTNWEFLKVFGSGVIFASAVIFFFAKGIATLKSLWPNRAKPQLLDVQYCFIVIMPDFEQFWFELLVNNAGSKDCSVISAELMLPNGDISTLVWEPSTNLPKTILAGRTERITRKGQCGGVEQYGRCKGKLPRPVLQPQNNSVEGTVAVKFNTGHIIKRKVNFTVGRPL
jgi:hypothetical protein